MSSRQELEKECRTYTHYLIGEPPDGYVETKYIDYHLRARAEVAPRDLFDEKLASLSARGVWWARIVDAYACRFYPTSAVRRKLVLTLALIECSPPSFRRLDVPERVGLFPTLANLAWHAIRFALATGAGTILLSPLRVLCAAAACRSAEKRKWKESL